MSEILTDEELEDIGSQIDANDCVPRLIATVKHYKKLWQRSNEAAADYRAKAEKLAEIHRQIHDTLQKRMLEAMKHEF